MSFRMAGCGGAWKTRLGRREIPRVVDQIKFGVHALALWLDGGVPLANNVALAVDASEEGARWDGRWILDDPCKLAGKAMLLIQEACNL
jgi:hypothetical protein